MRYGEALGAERLVETNNVAGAFNASTPSVRELVKKGFDAVFSELNLDSQEVVEIPKMRANTCQLITGIDNDNWRIQGIPEDLADQQKRAEKHFGALGINMFATCTPYQVGNVPVKGEHCAWMESSAVVYCNSILGARTNTEGKESTGAAALTGRIPYWGYHIPENRRGTHLVEVDVEVEDIMDYGLLGYWVGEIVQEEIPVLTGKLKNPSLIKFKHFGAAAASSGGVEMYHVPGVTPEARDVEEAFGGRKIGDKLRYGPAERKLAYDRSELLGQPRCRFRHARLSAQRDRTGLADRPDARRQEAQPEHPALGSYAARVARSRRRNGYVKMITDAGGVVMSDTCPGDLALRAERHAGIATDSAKQAHYLPAILGLPVWFGTVKDCVECRADRPLERRTAMSERLRTTRSCCMAARSSAASPKAKRW